MKWAEWSAIALAWLMFLFGAAVWIRLLIEWNWESRRIAENTLRYIDWLRDMEPDE